jgi:sugar lactone lactonase YvrE
MDRLSAGYFSDSQNGNSRVFIAMLMKTAWLVMPVVFGQTWIEQYSSESTAANKTCAAKEYSECRQHLTHLRDLLDGRADIVYRLAKVEAALGNRDAALDWLTIYSKSGLTFADPASDPDLAPLKESAAFKTVLERIANARKSISTSTTFLTLPEKDLISEDLAYDPVAGRFYISSVRHRKILSADKNGKFAEFVAEEQPGIWGILAVHVDAKRRCLWASTAATAESAGYNAADEGRSALLKYSLDSGALLKRYDVKTDGKHVLGDMTVSSAGDVFASDGYGAVYWVDHVHDTLEVLVDKGTFRSPQTPALSPDEHRLFIPDYSRGISILDLKTKQVKLLEHPSELSLGGIDGLYLAGRTLIAIQNGTAPNRVIRMSLDPSLTRALRWETIECNWAGLGAPTHGVVAGREFYFLANSGWDRLGDNGALKPGAAFDSPTIQRMALDAKPQK